MSFASVRRGVVCFAIFVASVVAIEAQTVRYIYDELGRLVAVIDQNGDAAVYNYDAVGNLLSITRQSSGTVSILEFTPNGGTIGSAVKLFGTGFSATANQNAVTFNGTAATVASSTTTEIVTSVPSGATTGTIAVTTPFGSATSTGAFTVSASVAPTITSVSPTQGLAGTSVTISGTNFQTITSNNLVRFNTTPAVVGSASSTSIATSVPSAATSGKISVATPFGSATDTSDFIIPPSPYGTSDIALTDRMSIGTSKSVTVGTANKIALVLFDGTAGQRVSLKVSTGVLAFVTLYNHDGSTLGIASAGSAETFIEPVTLPVNGTYTILVDPLSTNTGTLTVTLYDVVDLSGSMTANGSSQTVTISTPGQVARLSFSGTAGQRVSLKVGTGPIGAVSLIGPDRSTIASLSINPALTSFIDTQTLPMTGTYAVVVDYSAKQTGSVVLNLYTVPADVTSTITAGGSAVTLTTTTPGQNGIATFTGTSGHRMSILISGVTAGTVVVSLRDPNGASVTSLTVAVLGGFIEPQTLSASGTHTIVADPGGASTGNVTLTLYDTPADVTSTITAGGSGVTLTTTPGQNGSVTFTGTSGHRMSILISSVSAGTVVVTLRDPSGASLTSLTVGFLGGFIEPKTLSASGTHTIVADPSGAGAGSVTLTLYDTPADVSGTLTVNGGGTAVTLSTAGQNASYTFSGTASQLVTVRITSNAIKTPANAAGLVTVKLVRANGTVLTTTTSSAASFNLTQQTLPATETYTVVIDPAGANTGGLTVSVTNP